MALKEAFYRQSAPNLTNLFATARFLPRAERFCWCGGRFCRSQMTIRIEMIIHQAMERSPQTVVALVTLPRSFPRGNTRVSRRVAPPEVLVFFVVIYFQGAGIPSRWRRDPAAPDRGTRSVHVSCSRAMDVQNPVTVTRVVVVTLEVQDLLRLWF